MNPDQTALGSDCLQFRLPKYIMMREQTTFILIGGKRTKVYIEDLT